MFFMLCDTIKDKFRKIDLSKRDYRTLEDKAFTISDENWNQQKMISNVQIHPYLECNQTLMLLWLHIH